MSLFDKGVSEEKRQSLELSEASREQEWHHPSFALQLFHGRPQWDLIFPFPRQSREDAKKGDDFLERLETFVKACLDPDEVDRTGEIPAHVLEGLKNLGAFGIKIPTEYGGLGLSQTNYNRAVHLLASYCGSTAVLVSAHQSIGVPQPLKMFGTPEQKKTFLPRFAAGEISAFALTEPEAGSDPRMMKTTATPIENGKAFLINGEKLWCTNAGIAGVIVVMAVTPPKMVKGREVKQITAFILETKTPGFSVVHRCRFMGLNGITNNYLRFTDVRVPRENIILGEGQGLKLALMTLNTGRLTLPAASTGVAKWCLHVSRQWAVKRRQWGGPIGGHALVAARLADMAAHTFAMDALSWLTSAMADDQKRDIRIEAAMAKYFATEHCWRIVDHTLQIRGGQGYERASSLKARGMDYWPVERVLRDMRINLIIEGTSEIMTLFTAREALDPHLSRLMPFLKGGGNPAVLMKAAASAIGYYLPWYTQMWLPSYAPPQLSDLPAPLARHMYDVQAASKQLARTVFHQMARHQQKLEAHQMVLKRIVDIGTDLLAMSASCSYAQALLNDGKDKANALDLADLFCRQAKARVQRAFREMSSADDRVVRTTARQILADQFVWLENDIIK